MKSSEQYSRLTENLSRGGKRQYGTSCSRGTIR